MQVVDALVDGCRPEEDPEQRDVDSRANCVRALGRATTTLYIRTASNASRTSSTINTNITGTPSPSAAASSAPSNVIVFRVLPCLERALADYTTDNRGDVGSLVREAAMEVMVGCLRLLPGCWDEATCRQQLPGQCHTECPCSYSMHVVV